MENEFLEISKKRKLEIENPIISESYKQKISGFNTKQELTLFLAEEPKVEYNTEINLKKVISSKIK